MTTRWVWALAEQQVWMTQGGGCSRGTFPLFLRVNQNWQRRLSNKLCVLFLTGFQFSSHASDTKPPAVTNSWQRNLIGAFPITDPNNVCWLATRWIQRINPAAVGSTPGWYGKLVTGWQMDDCWTMFEEKDHWLYIKIGWSHCGFMLIVLSYLLSCRSSK